MKKILTLIALCALLAAFTATAQASPVYGTDHYDSGDFTFGQKSDIFQANFSISENQAVWIFTDSYYKHNTDFGIILWDADTGKMVGANEDGNTSQVSHADTSKDGGNSRVGSNDAVIIRSDLKAGNYIITLLPFVNGQPADNYHFNHIDDFLAYRAKFTDAFTGDFSLNVVYKGGGTPAVPIPASALLLAPGLAAIGMLRRKFA